MTENSQGKIRYLCPYCSIEYGHFEGLKAHILADHRNEPIPTPKGLITLTINNQVYSLKVAPEWTLYDLIHDKLGLIGAKQFCDRGACGSCTVIMEGRVILSCMTLAIECDAKEIETVEGISEAEHPLIESYAKHHAMQCGYCTPGFVVSAKALLDKNPDPTEDEIKDALAGNLCRCGTYPQHPIAIKEAAQEKKKYPHGKKQAMTPRDDAQKMSIATRAVEALETLKEGEQDGQ